MLHVFWGLLNLFFIAGFFVICFYAVKLIRLRFGLFVAIVFVCGLLSFINKGDEKNETRQMRKLNFAGQSTTSLAYQPGTWALEDSMAPQYVFQNTKQITVHENTLFSIILMVGYGVEKEAGRLAPLYAYSSVSGIISGVNWKPSPPILYANEAGTELNYILEGIIEWKLMNIVLYSEQKKFTGSIKAGDESPHR